jgi:dipeptidyl aminopeptidase/acylaminoacyl peptidase
MNSQQNKPRRLKRRLFWISVALVVVVVIAILGISVYAASSLTQFEREPILNTPTDYGLEYVDVSFPSRDGLMLKGWWLGTQDDMPVIVMVHGSTRNRVNPPERMLGIASELVNNNYNVLMFDMRGHGESEGKRVSAGLYEINDLLGAIDYIKQRGIVSKIGALGFSMGAATCLMTTPECEEIDAVIVDGAYADIVSIVESEFANRSDLPQFFLPIILFMTKNLYHVDFTALRPIETTKKITVPVFVIHGGQDTTVPVEHANRIAEVCQSPYSRLWIVPEAEHCEAYMERPEEYVNKLLSFFDEAFELTIP